MPLAYGGGQAFRTSEWAAGDEACKTRLQLRDFLGCSPQPDETRLLHRDYLDCSPQPDETRLQRRDILDCSP